MFIDGFFWKSEIMYSCIKYLNVVIGNTLKSENVRMKVASAFQNACPAPKGCLLMAVPDGSLSFTASLVLLHAKDRLALEDAV